MWYCMYTAGGSCQSQTFWRNKHPESHQTLHWSRAIYHQREGSEISFECLGLKGWLQQPMFMFCNLNCWLELEGKRTLLCNVAVIERRDNDRLSLVMDLNSNTHTDTASVQMWLHCTAKLHIISFSAVMVRITVRRFITSNKAFL